MLLSGEDKVKNSNSTTINSIELRENGYVNPIIRPNQKDS
jgi:hypothetical protein